MKGNRFASAVGGRLKGGRPARAEPLEEVPEAGWQSCYKCGCRYKGDECSMCAEKDRRRG